MNKKEYNSIRTLMRHLRNNKNISIKGSEQKKQLEVIGYYHSYKGYRFIRDRRDLLSFNNFGDLYELVKFEYKLKELFYPVLMKIETGLKNIVIENTIAQAHNNYFDKIVNKCIDSNKKLSFSKMWYNSLENKSIKKQVDYFTSRNYDIPFWVVVDKLTFDKFIDMYQFLDSSLRQQISNNLNVNSDNDLYHHMILLKNLRNAVAHNNVIFDCRFYNSSPSNSSLSFVDRYLPYGYNANFDKRLVDYAVLCAFYLTNLGFKKKEIGDFIKDMENAYSSYFVDNNRVAVQFMSINDINILNNAKHIQF